MKYYLVSVKMKWGEVKKGVRPSAIEAATIRQKEFSEKANKAFGKDNISEVRVSKLPQDHPLVDKYKKAHPGG